MNLWGHSYSNYHTSHIFISSLCVCASMCGICSDVGVSLHSRIHTKARRGHLVSPITVHFFFGGSVSPRTCHPVSLTGWKSAILAVLPSPPALEQIHRLCSGARMGTHAHEYATSALNSLSTESSLQPLLLLYDTHIQIFIYILTVSTHANK